MIENRGTRMNWNISAWSIRRPVPALVLFMVLIALGYVSFGQLPITRFPNIDIPIVQVRVYQSGAAPSELEVQVTKKIEDAIAGVNGVKHQTSTVTEGSSVTAIEFRLEVNQDRALNDVKDAIARIRSELPRTIEEPIVQRIEIEGLPIQTYAARAPGMTHEQLSWFVDDTVIRALQGVKGVSQIERIGGAEREIRIALDPDRLLAFGITAGDVNRQLRATNVDLAGGRGEIGGREQAIRTLAGKQTVEDLAATMITLPRGRKVRLDQLGTVTDAIAEPRTFAALDGSSVVAFAISRAKGASDTVVAADVARKIEELQKANPDVELKLIDSMVTYTLGAYESTMKTMIEGAILAIVVVFIFLRDWRATLIAAIALPLSIIPAFWALDVAGFSLNLVSLLAITIVTGILVDDAIVEIENIVRHMRMGKSAYRAALEAADEIGLAVIAITFTIIAVFVPVSFMGGIAGQYFKQFGLVVAFAVLFSLLVARLITPLLAAYFMRASGHEEKESRLLRAYTHVVRWSVGHQYKAVALGIADLRRLDRQLLSAARGLPAGRGQQPHAAGHRAAARLAHGGDARRHRRARAADPRAAGGEERIRQRRPRAGLGQRGAQGDARHQPGVRRRQRKLSQAQVKEEISRSLAGVPDIRFWFLQDNGQRQFQLVVSGRDAAAVTHVGGRADQPGQAHSRCWSTWSRRPSSTGPSCAWCRSPTSPPSSASRPRPSRKPCASPPSATSAPTSPSSTSATARCRSACSSRTSARGDRHLLESLKVATSSGAAVPLSAVAQLRVRPGPDRHRPLRPHAARPDRRRPGRQDPARRRGGGRAGPARGEEPARRRRDQAVRRRRDHERGVRELRQGDGRRHHDGLRRAGAAVRQLPAAGHHPVLAAAVDRRRHRGAGHHLDSRSACRW